LSIIYRSVCERPVPRLTRSTALAACSRANSANSIILHAASALGPSHAASALGTVSSGNKTIGRGSTMSVPHATSVPFRRSRRAPNRLHMCGGGPCQARSSRQGRNMVPVHLLWSDLMARAGHAKNASRRAWAARRSQRLCAGNAAALLTGGHAEWIQRLRRVRSDVNQRP
jgi:hypothetical protein